MKLDKESVKNLPKLKSKVVELDGYQVRILEMTIKQQLKIEEILQNKSSNGDIVGPVLKFCVVDDDNQPLFDDVTIEHLSAGFAAKLFQECIAHNSIDEKELEGRAKNF